MRNAKEKHPMTTYLNTYGEGSATVNGYTVQIRHDEFAINPRKDYDNDSTLILFSGNRMRGADAAWLSDEHVQGEASRWGIDEYVESLAGYSISDEDDKMGQEMPLQWHEMRISSLLHKKYAVVGLRHYDHGCNGYQVYSNGMYDVNLSMTDRTDGLIHMPINDESETEEKIKIMQAELSEYNAYLSGDVWGFTIEKEGVDIDSCWGFYGDHDESGLFDAIMYTVSPLTTTTDNRCEVKV